MAAGFNSYTIVLIGNTVTDETTGEVTVSGLPTKEGLATIFERFEGTNVKIDIRLHHGLLDVTDENGEPINIFTEYYSDVDFLSYPTFSGFFIADEPSWGQLETIENVYVPWFNENYGGSRLEFFVNMLSGYSTAMGGLRDINGNLVTNNGTYKTGGNINALYDGEKAYDAKVSWYLKEVTVKLTEQEKADMTTAYHNKWLDIFAKVNSANKCFSHDVYPFFDNQTGKIIITDAEMYEKYANLSWLEGGYLLSDLPEDYEYVFLDSWLSRSLNIAILAKENGYSYGACIQTFDQGGVGSPYQNHTYRAPTTLAELRWQVYMNLAMGAKKLNYFAFGQQDNGMYMCIGTDTTPIYDLVVEMNNELNAVDYVFASFETWVGLKTFAATGKDLSTGLQMVADKGQNLDGLTNVTSVTTSKELVVGEMIDGDGNHGYMLVGYGDPMIDGEATDVSINFDGAAGFIVYRGGERTLVEAVDGVFSATLLAGEGVFVIPVYMD